MNHPPAHSEHVSLASSDHLTGDPGGCGAVISLDAEGPEPMAETMNEHLVHSEEAGTADHQTEHWPWTEGCDRRQLSRLVRRLEHRLLCAEASLWDQWHREVYELRSRLDDPDAAIDGSATRLAEIAAHLDQRRAAT